MGLPYRSPDSPEINLRVIRCPQQFQQLQLADSKGLDILSFADKLKPRRHFPRSK